MDHTAHPPPAPHSPHRDATWAHLAREDAMVSAALAAALEHTTAVATAAGPPRLVADLGSGTGAGTLALAARLPDARVVAVDASEVLLGQVADRARRHGLADRVATVACDLDRGWPAAPDGTGPLDGLDLTWASLAVHHLHDPAAVLARVRAATRPGGHLALLEDATPLLLLADTLPGVGAGWERHLVSSARHAHHPSPAAGWSERVAAAGWRVVLDVAVPVGLDRDDPAAVAAATEVARSRLTRAADDAGHPDRVALRELVRRVGGGEVDLADHLDVRGRWQLVVGRREG